MAVAPDVLPALRPAEARSSRRLPVAGSGVPVAVVQALDGSQAAAVQALAAECARWDRVFPLCEQTLLRLACGGDGERFALLARDCGGALIGYAQAGAMNDDLSADLCVGPVARGQGLGRCLLAALERRAARLGRDRLHLWARGDLPAARWLLLTRGATPDRALLELERPLQDLPPAALPPGISLRPFVPGQDDAAWLALHHRCFGWHPEQATWTLADLRARLVQPWFRAAGFLLAEGVGRARLFVESDNRPARRLYDALGFHRRQLHVCYRLSIPTQDEVEGAAASPPEARRCWRNTRRTSPPGQNGPGRRESRSAAGAHGPGGRGGRVPAPAPSHSGGRPGAGAAVRPPRASAPPRHRSGGGAPGPALPGTPECGRPWRG